MPKSTPEDLAVAFRSLVRRRREAVDSAEGAPVGGLLAELDRHIADAASLVGAAPEATAVADAIVATPADDWDPATLEQLRRIAIDAGTTLRRIAASGPPHDDE